ncbi:MAG: signal peptidase I [Clostridiales bacterium]|nr:signal peptidase I [Clostridiales bacterium]
MGRIERKEAENDNKKKDKKSTLKEWAKTIIIPIVVALLILQIIRPTLVQQQSMLPTVEPNDYLIVYKLAYKLGGGPDNGDIIVFESDLEMDDGSNKYLIKRVIATEGQTIQITDGEVYVDGVQLEEPYINGGYTPGDVLPVEVPEDSVFVMGDNRPNSTDSRNSDVGFVKEDTIMGKVVFRLFPFNKIGGLY